jgi:hypothetical protein
MTFLQTTHPRDREPLQTSHRSADPQPSLHQDHTQTRPFMSCSIESTVRDLLDNDATKAIIEQHLPGITFHPQLDMALATVAKHTDGLISEDLLQKI